MLGVFVATATSLEPCLCGRLVWVVAGPARHGPMGAGRAARRCRLSADEGARHARGAGTLPSGSGNGALSVAASAKLRPPQPACSPGTPSTTTALVRCAHCRRRQRRGPSPRTRPRAHLRTVKLDTPPATMRSDRCEPPFHHASTVHLLAACCLTMPHPLHCCSLCYGPKYRQLPCRPRSVLAE